MPPIDFPLPVFIVNLTRDVEKKEHMEGLCNRYGLAFEFISAVCGDSLGQNKIDVVYSKSTTVKTIGRGLSFSEIGCLLSHKAIYQKVVDEELGVCLILEDDIEFGEDLLHVLGGINTLPSDWEVVLLGHHGGGARLSNTKSCLWGRLNLSSSYELARPSELACGTYGYLINKRGASKLLAELELIALPIDHYTGDSSYINLYVVTPPVIGIHEDLSDNYHSMDERKELQAEQVALRNVASFSWYKKMAIYLGLYHYLNNGFIIMSGALQQIMPLRKYK